MNVGDNVIVETKDGKRHLGSLQRVDTHAVTIQYMNGKIKTIPRVVIRDIWKHGG